MNAIRFTVWPLHRTGSWALILFGASAATYGLYAAPDRTWPNLLLNGFYFTSLALSAALFLATQRLTGARWSASLRRIPEAFMMALPVAAVLMMMLFFGRDILYSWTHPGAFSNAPAIAGKAQYLRLPWVSGRSLISLAAWAALAGLMRKASLDQDRDPRSSLILHQRLTRYAILFVVVFAVTFSMGAVDWILSLNHDWFSTMFAVSTFWAYIWTCQYLLIWYANIPEEAIHYVKRTNGPWLMLFALNFVVNWVVPFAALLSMRSKRDSRTLKSISVLLLLGHWLDLYILIVPSLSDRPRIGFPELLIAAGYGALFYLIFIRNLAAAPVAPLYDPILLADTIGSGALANPIHAWPPE